MSRTIQKSHACQFSTLMRWDLLQNQSFFATIEWSVQIYTKSHVSESIPSCKCRYGWMGSIYKKQLLGIEWNAQICIEKSFLLIPSPMELGINLQNNYSLGLNEESSYAWKICLPPYPSEGLRCQCIKFSFASNWMKYQDLDRKAMFT